MSNCERPSLTGDRNRDLWQAYQSRGAAIDACNAEKRKLRQWAEEYGK